MDIFDLLLHRRDESFSTSAVASFVTQNALHFVDYAPIVTEIAAVFQHEVSLSKIKIKAGEYSFKKGTS